MQDYRWHVLGGMVLLIRVPRSLEILMVVTVKTPNNDGTSEGSVVLIGLVSGRWLLTRTMSRIGLYDVPSLGIHGYPAKYLVF